MTQRHIGSEVIDCTATDVGEELREHTGGRGPGVCIEAVGMEARSDSPVHLYDQVEQQLRLQTDPPYGTDRAGRPAARPTPPPDAAGTAGGRGTAHRAPGDPSDGCVRGRPARRLSVLVCGAC
ncbi:hypothetical protein [Streptomyces canus]|uniref:hypothetical protein n=1 Tax=Streptomyces canus TaxID=58343 RepID=UPI00277FEC3D|nr:hypothetical protein [Streptomyces canus]MDQ1073406.1 threonine dehydrogenase-like Zn-dependent dehydrogenase [Streptomyces canus]